jgi:FixJ family two-component response regulator
MNGLQLHRKLLASGGRVPVIFITAFPDERVRKQALKAGAVCYLSKPFDGESIASLAAVSSSEDELHRVNRHGAGLLARRQV